MQIYEDTIAAISTAPGEAGISVVRISGPKAVGIADTVVRLRRGNLASKPGWSFAYGHAVSPNDEIIDEVVTLVYRAPHSYTREDVVEIQCHGGRVQSRRILSALAAKGARLAEPGEFTKRAFLNGRLDLVQAEAVADIIHAKSNAAANAAMEQLEGCLSSLLSSIYDSLIAVSADVEATLDFGEDEIPEECLDDIERRLKDINDRMSSLLATWDAGRILREGIKVVISGKPNSGKSTLMNYLLGTNRAIVSEIPGTTRDTIEEQIIIAGTAVRLVDTAGLRGTECKVEREGVSRAYASMERADINMHVIDASLPVDPDELALLGKYGKAKVLIVLNKTDLGIRVKKADFEGFLAVECSLLNGTGVQGIHRALRTRIESITGGEPHAAISERHRQLLQNGQNAMNEAMERLSPSQQDMLVIVAERLRYGAESIGAILGRTYSEDLLNQVFSRFCIGK